MCKIEKDVLEIEKGIQLEEKKTQQNNEQKKEGETNQSIGQRGEHLQNKEVAMNRG